VKWFKRVFIGAIAIIALSFLVPTVPEYNADKSVEKIVAINVSETGERLLVRTLQHDYQFTLPPNHLNDLPLSSCTQALSNWISQTGFDLNEIRLDPTGAAKASIAMLFGGYDSTLPVVKSILLESDRKRLLELGFSPSNGNVLGLLDEPLYMEWRADLSGQQYPANSREKYAGASLCVSGKPFVSVLVEDPIALRRNRNIRLILSPLTALRDGIQQILFILLIIMTGGAHLGPVG
jgi:hypothetical protein